jgi:hypothetical protein
MKKLLFFTQGMLFVAFNFFLLLTIFQMAGSPNKLNRLGYEAPTYNGKEDYDPSLARLNNLSKLTAYCDSAYQERSIEHGNLEYESAYPELVSEVVRKRFFHGYSLYNFNNNYMAMLMSKFGMNGLSAIVIANDILRYPFAACSQQSIVLMDLLKEKGFQTRKVGFIGHRGGHFCFEVYYKGNWHFYDPDMEPDVKVLNAYNRPDIAFLTRHSDVLMSAYRQYPLEKINDLFLVYHYYGKVNAPAAPRAYFFQQITKFLSYTMWTFFLVLFILVRRKYLQLKYNKRVRNHRVRFPQLQPGTAGSYNLEY